MTESLTKEQIVIASGSYPHFDNDALQKFYVEILSRSKKNMFLFLKVFVLMIVVSIPMRWFLTASLIAFFLSFLVVLAVVVQQLQLENTLIFIEREMKRREITPI